MRATRVATELGLKTITMSPLGEGPRFLAAIRRRMGESTFSVFKFQDKSVRKQAVWLKRGIFSDLQDDVIGYSFDMNSSSVSYTRLLISRYCHLNLWIPHCRVSILH